MLSNFNIWTVEGNLFIILLELQGCYATDEIMTDLNN